MSIGIIFLLFCRQLMDNQVAMSEEERQKILQEHEKQMVKLENKWETIEQLYYECRIIKLMLCIWFNLQLIDSITFLPASLTLTKLQQKRMLEEKLARRKEQQMEKLERKQFTEEKVCQTWNILTCGLWSFDLRMSTIFSLDHLHAQVSTVCYIQNQISCIQYVCHYAWE